MAAHYKNVCLFCGGWMIGGKMGGQLLKPVNCDRLASG